jgi:hypothetical protein
MNMIKWVDLILLALLCGPGLSTPPHSCGKPYETRRPSAAFRSIRSLTFRMLLALNVLPLVHISDLIFERTYRFSFGVPTDPLGYDIKYYLGSQSSFFWLTWTPGENRPGLTEFCTFRLRPPGSTSSHTRVTPVFP